jgi:NitT/TauT family transport system substrate-binding protein
LIIKGKAKTNEVKMLVIFAVAILFILSGQGNGVAEDLSTIKVSFIPYISYAPIFIAIEEGYFNEQGLNIELLKTQISGQEIPALASGSLDVSTSVMGSNLFAAISRGLKIKIVADKGHLHPGCNYGAIMARKALFESGEVTNIKQLKGKKVALSPIPVLGYIYEKILNSGGLTLNDIEIVRMPISATVEALKSGAIDATSAAEPVITQLEAMEYAVKLAEYEDFYPHYQLAFIIYGPKLIEKHHELGRKFMVAYLKGVRLYNEGKIERNVEIFQKYTGLDPDILRRICLPPIYSDGHVNTQSIVAFQDWAYEKGFIDSKIALDQLIDMSFAEYAYGILEKSEGN